jgi:hypothetical protein
MWLAGRNQNLEIPANNNMNQSGKFVLIGGMPRSGTTLLETIIGSHSRISIPPGDYPFAEQYARGLSVRRIFDVLQSKETWGLWEQQCFDTLLDKRHDDAFRQSLIDYCAAVGKDIPGCKSPYSEFFFDTYLSWLRGFDVKFVHVVRNPFDVMASLKHSSIHRNLRVFEDTLEKQARNWLRSTTLGLARQVSHPENYFLLGYEAFVEDPRRSVIDLCRFIDVLPQEERMLNRADYGYHDTNSSFSGSAQQRGEQTGYVYRSTSRKAFLDAQQIEMIGRICGEAAHAVGYVDDNFRPDAPEYPEQLKASVRFRRKTRRLIRNAMR